MSRDKPLVYIAGPYRKPDPVFNTATAVDVGADIRDDLGVAVIIPHLSMFEHFQRPRAEGYWLDVTLDLLRCCDAMYRIQGYSAGSDEEEAEAIRLGIPVFRTRSALSEWISNWKDKHDACAK